MGKLKFSRTVQSSVPLPWKPQKKGERIEGEFLGTATVAGKKGNGDFNSHRIRLTESVKAMFGDTVREKKAGDVIAVSGAMLDSRFDQIPTGAGVEVTFKGMYTTDRGDGRDYEVRVADGVDLLDPNDEANR